MVSVLTDYQKPITIVLFALIALVISASLLFLFGVPPLTGIATLFTTGFGPKQGLLSTLDVAGPLILVSVGLAIPFTAGFLNIGGQGQYILGEIVGTWVGLVLSNSLPPILVFLAAFVGAFLGGALWAIPPTLMKLNLRISEVITTLMMNFIAVFLLDYLVSGPMEGHQAASFHEPASDPIPAVLRLPKLVGGVQLSSGILFSIAFAVAIYFTLRYTRFGYELKIIGAKEEVALYAGINVRRDTFLSMLISGGLAGLAGMIVVYGTTTELVPQFFSDITTSFGYVGIPAALIALLNPLTIMFSSTFFAGILIGGYGLEGSYGIPIDLVTTIYGLVMFLTLVGAYVDLGKLFRRSKK